MSKKATSVQVAAGPSSTPRVIEAIKALLPEQDFPAVYEALSGVRGDRLSVELHRLLSSRLLTRPPRRPIKRIARLIAGEYDEVVMLKDVSVTGVRLLLSETLDLKQTLDMKLEVRLPSGRHTIPLSLVRLCGQQGSHLDIGCRFLLAAGQQEALATEIREHFFER